MARMRSSTKARNIAFVLPSLEGGGSERMASRLSRLFAETDNLYCFVFDGRTRSYEFSGRIVDYGVLPARSRLTKVFALARKILMTAKLLREHEIDVAICFTATTNYVVALAPYRCRKILACRGYGYLSGHERLFHFLLRRSDLILFNSSELRDCYLKFFSGDREKTRTIYNLLDLGEIRRRSDTSVADSGHRRFLETRRVILYVGQFSFNKGLWNLLKAFDIIKREYPDAGLMLVGNRGEHEEEIRRMAEQSAYTDDICLAGAQENPYQYMAMASCLALTSITEGFPNVILEAMACGTPVVAANCPTGPWELLSGGEAGSAEVGGYRVMPYGILAPAFGRNVDFSYRETREARIFAEALKALLGDPGLVSRLRENAMRFASRFDEVAMISEYREMVASVCEAGGAARS